MEEKNIVWYMNRCLLLLTVLCVFAGCAFFKEAIKEPEFDPEKSFEEANDLMDEGFNEKAREILETILAKDASRKYSTLARIRIGDT